MNEIVELMDFVLTAAETQPLRKRIALYRGLARICGDPAEQKEITQLADRLQLADQLCNEFNFSFIQKNKDK